MIPTHLFYSKDHEWLRIDGAEATIGITAFAAGELGDIVFVDIPETGVRFEAGAVFGTIEAVKTVSDLFLPVSGVITSINPGLSAAPEVINSDPYGEGWLIRIVVDNRRELEDLLDADDYQKLLGQ